MNLRISNEDIEFEINKSIKNNDIIMGINIIEPISREDLMTISLTLAKTEYEQLKSLFMEESDE